MPNYFPLALASASAALVLAPTSSASSSVFKTCWLKKCWPGGVDVSIHPCSHNRSLTLEFLKHDIAPFGPKHSAHMPGGNNGAISHGFTAYMHKLFGPFLRFSCRHIPDMPFQDLPPFPPKCSIENCFASFPLRTQPISIIMLIHQCLTWGFARHHMQQKTKAPAIYCGWSD